MVQIEDAVMVVAHPDDEILWFSSILGQCKSVLVCFGPSATSRQSWDSGRDAVMRTYPLDKVRFLKIRESDAFEAANWNDPEEAGSGLRLRRGRTSSLYDGNAEKLLHLLEAHLSHESVVFTHNPWGEYGNEEHVQVFRILRKLRDRLGFDLFVSSYVSNRSVKLMSRYAHSLEGNHALRETDVALAHSLKDLYLRNDCWTWMADYEWPDYESFYRVVQPGEDLARGTRASLPLNYIPHHFNQSEMRKIASRVLPTSVKSVLKQVRL
ncbi:GlcNAc-PI de-N-acetylase [Mycolicibacterium litorale]|uniref:GlcNAc-PI de-N-acetylase n=1 Tax=Mycolicibacterium litorale TaxID=758802 RepID=UPI003CEBDE95